MTNIENVDSSIFANVFKGVYLNFIADYTKNMNRLFEYKSVASRHWRADRLKHVFYCETSGSLLPPTVYIQYDSVKLVNSLFLH